MSLCHAWGGRGACIGLVGRLGIKKPIGRHRHIWEGNKSMDLKKCYTVWNRFNSRWRLLVSCYECCNEPLGFRSLAYREFIELLINVGVC